ncbi:endospore germination permease [Paenibacillus albicereus]|uniref:Endospore germination permease n=1 Tax=Paenibacillus albicereus TaxID=2726185 RepID=A0A6H2GV82_9BACL|nr:endospore germination permease [Paenibacillus albicereus]QJC51076.1 endospore germination permease [Paenibacillus albicereus]
MNRVENGRITARQLKIMIIFALIGDSILILPNLMGNIARQDAWLSQLAAIACGMGMAWAYAALLGRLGRLSLVGAWTALLGRIAGGLLGLVYAYAFYIMVLSLLAEISLFMRAQMMHETPAEAIMLSFLIVLTAGMRYGVETFARTSELLYPIFVAMFVFLSLCLLPQIKPDQLLPIARTGLPSIAEGTLLAFSYGFLEAAVLLMLAPYVKEDDEKAARSAVFQGFFTGGLLLFLLMLLCVLVLGPNMMALKHYPTFLLAQRIEIGRFLERMEAFLIFLWIVTVFYKALLYSFSLQKAIGELARLRDDRVLAMPLALLLLAGGMISVPNIAAYNKLIQAYFPYYDLIVYLGLPLLLLALLAIPAARRRLEAKQPSASAAAGPVGASGDSGAG